MTTPLEQKSVIPPQLTDVLLNLKQDIFASLNCHMPGVIQSFNAVACTAVVQPVFKRQLPNGNIVSRPVLVDCPVLFPSGGGGRLTFPVAFGDQCLILYADRRIDEWLQTGGQALPGDPRMHDMSDAIVMVGLDPLASFGAVPAGKVVLSYQGAEIDLAAAIITIKNGTTTLLTLINGLITVIEGLQVNGPIPLTAASIASLEAYKTVLATLLG